MNLEAITQITFCEQFAVPATQTANRVLAGLPFGGKRVVADGALRVMVVHRPALRHRATAFASNDAGTADAVAA